MEQTHPPLLLRLAPLTAVVRGAFAPSNSLRSLKPKLNCRLYSKHEQQKPLTGPWWRPSSSAGNGRGWCSRSRRLSACWRWGRRRRRWSCRSPRGRWCWGGVRSSTGRPGSRRGSSGGRSARSACGWQGSWWRAGGRTPTRPSCPTWRRGRCTGWPPCKKKKKKK